MFNFTPPAPPTGKHHLHNHPNPVTVAELVARERTE